MSTYEEAIKLATADAAISAVPSRWQRIGDLLERAGEYFNPLLVKECRQALKSRQFAITFLLVLVLCWLWSLFGVAQMGPMAGYKFNGPGMFVGYFVVLAAALLVIVPYSAFRSLIAEREDNTYELVAITTLKPRQIIGGKLGSAVVQIFVYLSAVAPCLVFTYLLRGIDMPTILAILFYTVLGSIALSLCGLLVATFSKEKHWQIVISVIIIVALVIVFIYGCAAAASILRYSALEFHDPEFWIVNLCFLTFYSSTFVLLYLAAGAQLTFAAENRAQSLRVAMLAQHVLLTGWIAFFAVRDAIISDGRGIDDDVLGIYLSLTFMYWAFMGVLMSGESTELSPRVRRGLPKSLLGRVFLTWFAPGPGTGFMFALANVVAGGLLVISAAYVVETRSPAAGAGRIDFREMVSFFVIATCYLIIYLGCGNLLLRLLRRVLVVTLPGAFLLQIILLTIGIGLPFLLLYWSGDFGEQYSLMHISNPFWSSSIAVSPNAASSYTGQVMTFVIPLATVIFILNLLYVVPAVQALRIAKPQRVVEEDEALAAVLKPTIPQPTNPWDN